MVAERAREMFYADDHICAESFVYLSAFAVVAGVLMAVAFCLLHVCCALQTMIDSYGVSFLRSPDFGRAVHHWNILQAVLRKVSAAVDRCYVVLLTTGLAATLAPMLQGINNLAMLPAMVTVLVVARISLHAGAISYKCDRVPPLINSVSFGEGLDYGRQYVVQYIFNSKAGFYVSEVRITVDMVLKCSYIGVAICFAVTTRMLGS